MDIQHNQRNCEDLQSRQRVGAHSDDSRGVIVGEMDGRKHYVIINASNGEAVGVFPNSISARMALDGYLKSSFGNGPSLLPGYDYSSDIQIWLYRIWGEGSAYPDKWTFTRDNHKVLLSSIMI